MQPPGAVALGCSAQKILQPRPLPQNVNGLFTVTSKKLARGRRTEPRIHPPVQCAGSTRKSIRTLTVSTSDVGVGVNFGFPFQHQRHSTGSAARCPTAARRAGLPLSDWLNAIILQQAATQGIKTPSHVRGGDEAAGDDLSDLYLRTRRSYSPAATVTRTGAAAYAPKRSRGENTATADL